ncbi:Uncharacterised protein [Pseudomonas aeruginosa]|nr:Uncharacterised protein [Pseudomonas aeruginosa]
MSRHPLARAQPGGRLRTAEAAGGHPAAGFVVEEAADRHVLLGIGPAIVRGVPHHVAAGAVLLGRVGADDGGKGRQVDAVLPGPREGGEQPQDEQEEQGMATDHGRASPANAACARRRKFVVTETPVAVVGVAHDHQLLLGQHVERLAPVAERGEGGLGDVRPGRPRAFHRTVQPPLAARHRLALLFRARPVAGEGRQVELDPCQRQQLPLAPAPVALHQQADARQVAGAHVDVRRADERAGGVSLPYRRTDAQRLEQRAPGVLGIVRAEHAVEGRRQHVAVAAGVAETQARRPGLRGLGDEAGHVVTPTGVKHRHHGGFQWRELVVLLPVQPGRPVQQVA